jgi:hypothetical protein
MFRLVRLLTNWLFVRSLLVVISMAVRVIRELSSDTKARFFVAISDSDVLNKFLSILAMTVLSITIFRMRAS